VPPHNGFWLDEEAVIAGARLGRRVDELTEGTEFAAGSEVACHPNLSQPNFVFREMTPVAIIDWDGTRPGTRLSNFAQFLWAFVHPAVYGEGEPAASMLRVAVDAYGWSSGGLVDSMLETVRNFQAACAAISAPRNGVPGSSSIWSGTPSSSAPTCASLHASQAPISKERKCAHLSCPSRRPL